MLIFGGFLAGVLVILIGNGHIAPPVDWSELRQGVEAMFVRDVGPRGADVRMACAERQPGRCGIEHLANEPATEP